MMNFVIGPEGPKVSPAASKELSTKLNEDFMTW